MALGLRLRVTNTRDNTMMERTFDRFPVRIGRNPLNDLQLDAGFVSQFHCVLELHGQALMLRDLGSKNGTLLRTVGKVAAHQLIDLGPCNYEFAISALLFQAYSAEVAEEQRERRRTGAGLLLNASDEDPETQYAQAVGRPPAANVALTASKLKPYYDGYRQAWAQVYQALCVEAQTLEPQARGQLLDMLGATQPAMAAEPDFQRLLSVVRPDAPPANYGGKASRDDMVAFQAIKELAQTYLAGSRPLESANDAVRFLAKVQDVLDVFFKSFIPLRDGYKQFESKMEIKRTMRAGQTVGARVAVETAKDPKELASRVLDWTDNSNDGPRTIESTFADLMIHQIAMLDGVMRGVKSLLSELSPPAIEALAEKRKKGGFGPFRYESLWNLFKERHSDLADEEKEAFGLIFGPQFVTAYTQFSGDSPGAGKQTVSGASTAHFPAQSSMPDPYKR